MANVIEMPKLSDTMTTGTLVKWLKKEGDTVATGDMLAEVETDKATMELESFFDGTLLKIFIPAGSSVPIGAALCAVGKPGENVEAPASNEGAAPSPGTDASPKAKVQSSTEGSESRPGRGEETPQQGRPEARAGGPGSPGGAAAKSGAPSAPKPGAQGGTGESEGGGQRMRVSPLARKLAEEKKIDLGLLQGSGPGGRIVRVDILAAEKAGLAGKTAVAPRGGGNGVPSPFKGQAPSRSGPIQEEKLVTVSNMRATIARRLVESKSQIPHFYLDIEVDAGPLLDLRAQLNAALEAEGVKLSVNDFILKASVDALRRVPGVNCSWADPGTGQAAVRQHAAAHVSFAVAIDDGLITPVIKDAHLKTIFAISSEAKALAKRAKDRKLQPAEFTGGTFCVSNLGMMGIDRFNAIINPPNAAILAVGATVRKPVVRGEQIVIGQRLTLTLSVDHRVVDGVLGATFLGALKDILEKPAQLLL